MEQKWHCLPSLCNVSANCEQHFDTVTTFYHMACYEKQFTNNVNKKKKDMQKDSCNPPKQVAPPSSFHSIPASILTVLCHKMAG